MTPTAYGASPGDVVHVRSSGVYGWAIRRTLRSWGNHDGVLVYDVASGAWGVAEALCSAGFVVTPWSEYVARVEDGTRAVVLLRHASATSDARAAICEAALSMAAANQRYDWRGVFWIAANLACHSKTGRNWEHRWYCTEAVADLYRVVGLDVWGDHLPTPGTTAKRERDGKLIYLAEIGPTGWPAYRTGDR